MASNVVWLPTFLFGHKFVRLIIVCMSIFTLGQLLSVRSIVVSQSLGVGLNRKKTFQVHKSIIIFIGQEPYLSKKGLFKNNNLKKYIYLKKNKYKRNMIILSFLVKYLEKHYFFLLIFYNSYVRRVISLWEIRPNIKNASWIIAPLNYWMQVKWP